MIETRPFNAVVALATLFLLAPVPVSAADGLEHTFSSKILEQERTLTVHLPPSYQEQKEFSYPVLYLLDGESNAGYAVAVSNFLAETGVTPEVITIAVHAGATRSRDYLPPNPGGPNGTSGEAHRFLDHLEKELIPFIESEYRAAPLRLISGHSMGGLLVIQALVQRPGLFEAYLGQSPYVDDSIGGPMLERLAAQAAAPAAPDTATSDAGSVKAPTSNAEASGRSHAFYYFNLGDEPQLAPNFDRLQAMLKRSPHGAENPKRAAGGFSGSSEIEPGKGHMETRLMGHYKGLEGFFADTWKFSSEILAQEGASGFSAYVSKLNSRFGYKVLLNESVFQGAAQTLFSSQNAAGARAVGDLYVDYYPRSLIAHFLLANAQAGTGAREEALNSIGSAMSLYEAEPSEGFAPLYETIKQFKSSLEAK